MKKLVRLLTTFSVVLLLLPAFTQCKEEPREIMLCGDNKVWILDRDASNGTDIKVLWTWENTDVADQLPEIYQRYLNTMDECKFVSGNRLLFTASSGGTVLIDRETKKCLFYAYTPMAHSADLLPGDRIAVANSTHDNGNSIELYDINKPEQVIWKDTLYSGHGSVWMEERQRYYALGYDELREYSLKDWDSNSPFLQIERMWTIPNNSGHDLSYVSANELLVSDHHGVSLFNIDTEEFTPFAPLADSRNVKSVNFDKKTQSLVYTIGEESWWTHNIYFVNPDKVITIEEINMYKVRTK